MLSRLEQGIGPSACTLAGAVIREGGEQRQRGVYGTLSTSWRASALFYAHASNCRGRLAPACPMRARKGTPMSVRKSAPRSPVSEPPFFRDLLVGRCILLEADIDRRPDHPLKAPPCWAAEWSADYSLANERIFTRSEALEAQAVLNSTPGPWYLAFIIGQAGDDSSLFLQHGADATFHYDCSLSLVIPTAEEMNRYAPKRKRAG
jgi:hypothetical protein